MRKFKVGDIVKIVEHGYGIDKAGVGDIVQITKAKGMYVNQYGYVFESLSNRRYSTNCKDGMYGGLVGEKSFELLEDTPSNQSGFTKDE